MFTDIKNFKESEDGFTLIELLIVVVIIGILAAIAIPIFLNQQKAAIAAGVKSDVRNNLIHTQTYLTMHKGAILSEINVTSEPNSTAQTGTGAANFKLAKSSSDTKITIDGFGYAANGSEDSSNSSLKVVAYLITGYNDRLDGSYFYYSGSKNIATQFTGTGDFKS